MDLTARLDAMEAAIKKPSFRQSSGKAYDRARVKQADHRDLGIY